MKPNEMFINLEKKMNVNHCKVNEEKNENDIIVNIFIDEPGSELPSISLYFEDYYFHYFFNEETYELESYYVDIYNAW